MYLNGMHQMTDEEYRNARVKDLGEFLNAGKPYKPLVKLSILQRYRKWRDLGFVRNTPQNGEMRENAES